MTPGTFAHFVGFSRVNRYRVERKDWPQEPRTLCPESTGTVSAARPPLSGPTRSSSILTPADGCVLGTTPSQVSESTAPSELGVASLEEPHAALPFKVSDVSVPEQASIRQSPLTTCTAAECATFQECWLWRLLLVRARGLKGVADDPPRVIGHLCAEVVAVVAASTPQPPAKGVHVRV